MDVSIVIITWKMKNLLFALLNSLKAYSFGFCYELIIVDNFSNDGTIEMIEKQFPEAILIKNNENKGVAPARNKGIQIAKGRYILILDADMEFVENSIEVMLKYMDQNKDVGLMGCKLTTQTGELQYSCKRYPNLLALIARRLNGLPLINLSKELKDHLMEEWAHDSIQEVDYVIGACQLFRREVLEKIGFYDDRIFYGPEDIDYCLRVWHNGWRVVYAPITRIIHHEQRITKKSILSLISLKHLIGIFYLYKKYKRKLSRSN